MFTSIVPPTHQTLHYITRVTLKLMDIWYLKTQYVDGCAGRLLLTAPFQNKESLDLTSQHIMDNGSVVFAQSSQLTSRQLNADSVKQKLQITQPADNLTSKSFKLWHQSQEIIPSKRRKAEKSTSTHKSEQLISSRQWAVTTTAPLLSSNAAMVAVATLEH